MSVALSHVAIHVTQLEPALDFYCRKLGLEEAFRLEHEGQPSPWIVYLRAGPHAFIELFQGSDRGAQDPGRVARYDHICLQVDDLDTTLEELAQRGMALDGEPEVGL